MHRLDSHDQSACAVEVLSVHSSWRRYADNTALRGFLGDDLASRLVGVTSLDLPRQEGIEAFAKRAGVEHLLVIDDDRDSFDDAFEPLPLVDPDTGLSDVVVQRRVAVWLAETARRLRQGNRRIC